MKKRLRRVALVLSGAILIMILLFVLNGVFLAHGEVGTHGSAEDSATAVPRENPAQVRIMAFNIAKCFVMTGPVSFASEDVVTNRLQQMAAIIREHNPDIVCLSEAMTESGFCDVNQVETLAAKTGLKHWAFGENYNWGLPFLRVVGGNAVLSRYPVNPLDNLSLIGRQPFYVTKNNRRALLARVACPEGDICVWSVHNDSYDMDNNLRQMEQLLEHPETPGSVIAGDFNATPESQPLQTLWKSGQFSGEVDGDLTFPSDRPNQRIDFVFGPSNWEVVEHRVIPNDVSDHCAVLTIFDQKR